MRKWVIGMILVSMMAVCSSCRDSQPVPVPGEPLRPPAVIYDDR